MNQESSTVTVRTPSWGIPLFYVGLALVITNFIGWTTVPAFVIGLLWSPVLFPMFLIGVYAAVLFWPITLIGLVSLLIYYVV